ncbi:MAG TPA: DJ-1/PfpI family protein, partial [Acetobacteraceae bacterium]|nr:DJ-1/PfpI family protein [Acetobacteraceae bacterium]
MPDSPRFPPIAPRNPTPPRGIEVLAFPSVQLLDVAGPLQVFATTNDLAGEAPPYALRVVAAGGGLMSASAGLGLATAPLPAIDAALDTLLIAGGPGVHAAAADPALVGWVAARAGRARRVASVCTGAFLLGAAGL